MLALPNAITSGALLYIEQENLIVGKPEYALSNKHIGSFVCVSYHNRQTDRQTHKPNYRNPPAHASRGLTTPAGQKGIHFLYTFNATYSLVCKGNNDTL